MRRITTTIAAAVAGAALLATGAGLVGCGGSEDSSAATGAAAASAAEYEGVKGYLLDHTADLTTQTAKLREQAARYQALVDAAGGDYPKLLETKRSEVAGLVQDMQETFRAANPAYEEMEGVVAGVPSLSEYDVIIDAGASAKDDPQNAVPFDITTADGRVLKKPGNLFFLTETGLWGTVPEFAAKGVRPDLDGDGKVAFGEALPDAAILTAVTDEFTKQARALDADAKAWSPTDADVFTALVVMVPTMSEYFESWKRSRFVAGDKATEAAFVGTSRLSDIVDILEGLEVTYAGAKPKIAAADAPRADRIGEELTGLRAFVGGIRDREAAGERFTGQNADTFGTAAQDRAGGIAGEVSQAAGDLGVKIEQ